jgi:hypothetical protein
LDVPCDLKKQNYKHMKNINRIIILFLLSTVIFSCSEDLLDKTPIDRLSPGTFYQNESQATMALMGVYAALQPNATPTHFYQYDFMSDNGYCQDAWQGSLEIGEWKTNSSSWAPGAKWSMNYTIIARANQLIADIAKANVSDDIKTQMTAEAKFLRAFAYSDLIAFFGDVPLITKVQTLAEAYVSRTPKSEVLAAILTDLDDAAGVLPTSYSKAGRVTKGAAYAYKAKVLLYNGKWSESAAAAKACLDLGVYSLFTSYEGK